VTAGTQSKFFIPQKMFLSEGCSLRGQVTYPRTKEGLNPNEDDFILQILTDLGRIEISCQDCKKKYFKVLLSYQQDQLELPQLKIILEVIFAHENSSKKVNC
jgi:ABC-type uncharacterized transport system fused permease/ATPase subunit